MSRDENRPNPSQLFVDKTNEVSLAPVGLILVGILISAIIVISHFISFKHHIRLAEKKLNRHIEQLRFAERFNVLDESLTSLSIASSMSRDRNLLASYLKHERELDHVIKEYLATLD